jgi:hypothetical protein
MSVTLVPNSGIMSDDHLDKLRGEAIYAHHDTPMPDECVHYLRALEERYLDGLHQQKKRHAREIGWKLSKDNPHG